MTGATWRPLSEASKDGREILIRYTEPNFLGGGISHCIASWDKDLAVWADYFDNIYDFDENSQAQFTEIPA